MDEWNIEWQEGDMGGDRSDTEVTAKERGGDNPIAVLLVKIHAWIFTHQKSNVLWFRYY